MSDDILLEKDILSLLGDKHVQEILRVTSDSRVSATTLSEICDTSLATIYRRIDDLLEYELLNETTKIDKAGNHHSVYEVGIERATIDIEDGELKVRLRRRDQAADQFTSVWNEMRGDEQ